MAGGTLCPGAVASTLTRSDCGQGIQKLHPRERVDKEVWCVWGGGVGVRMVVCVHVCLCGVCVCAHNIHRSNVLVCLFGQCTLAPRIVPDLSAYSVNIHW